MMMWKISSINNIPKHFQNLVFGKAKAPAIQSIVNRSILTIWTCLLRPNPGALAKPKSQVLKVFGYRFLLPIFFVISSLGYGDKPVLNINYDIETNEEEPHVFGVFHSQLGNQMFIVAATCAHAWDHNAIPSFPDLVTNQTEGVPTNYEHVFFRCDATLPKAPISLNWKQPHKFHFSYTPIPYYPNMDIYGILQNEKYFAHHREKILNLFSPRDDDLAYIQEKYKDILNHPLTVGVQVRNFGVQKDKIAWWWGAQYGYDYFKQAMSLFPEESLFVVSTNDIEFARQNVPIGNYNVIFLEDEHYYIELFLLSMLKHNIITNSTFGWWAAWLNQNPEKVIITPKHWIDPDPKVLFGPMEIWPKGWIQIDAKWGKPNGDPGLLR